VIRDKKIAVKDGHVGQPDLQVTADSKTWLGFLKKEKSVVWALLRRTIRLQGPLKLLVAFGKCFPACEPDFHGFRRCHVDWPFPILTA
jgi:putative sterol carrier protein